MNEKELKKLNRAELLDLLLAQTKEAERLRKRLEKAEQELADQRLQVEKAGDLAHAVLEVNGVMEAAQAAAQQYLDNIIQMEKETKLRCDKMIAEAQKEAARISKSAPKPTSKKPNSDNNLIQEIYELLDEKK